MFSKHIIRFIHSKKATVTIEYGMGLALVGIVLIQGVTNTGTVTLDYMRNIATGGGATPAPPPPPP